MTGAVERCRTRQDLEGLTGLCRAHAAYEGLAFDPDGFEDRLAVWIEPPDPTLFLWMVRDGSEPLGYASASMEFSTLAAARYLHLDCLFVADHARSRGLGASLIAAAATLGRDRGLSRMEWQTPSWNTRAARFYERLGARAVSKLRFSADIEALRA